ncbi:FecCD family ABC transporter permease [Novispirillum itersonii]|uniref:Iron complex transport system permease protein n=1 Tax=Novispirillum itersonii TaxID=189 RepID=A0A7W9ZJE6_NOVIT|nr:iron ABC transporter permease [Novispirillum itersonii]MBB6211677.1 iron complex transport system permease protein [Novispirillum itersonii]
MIRLRFSLALLAGGLVLLAALAIGAGVGETAIPPDVVLKAVANRLWVAGYPIDPIDEGVIWSYRLSRTLMAACCGAGLAVSGVVLQSLLRNPLADPYVMGISAGASTGAVAVALLGLGGGVVSMSAGALAGALLAFGFVILLALKAGRSPVMVVLAGVAGSQLFNAITSFVVARSANAEQARGILFWLLGNLSGVRWPDVGLALPVLLVGMALCLWHVRVLDAFLFGSSSAAALGVSVRRVWVTLIGASAVMTAVMVSMVGSIGFVGLVVPHAVRLVAGVSHGRLLPLSALCGAVFLIIADVVSRALITGQVVPIGVVTALVGAPVFALLLIRGRTA